MQLVIVESPAKAKTIEKYLGTIPELKSSIEKYGKFKVMASLGHIRDLPQSSTGIQTSDWTATYTVLASKKEVVAKLSKEAKEATRVYLASDLDYEGEAIAFHLKTVLKLHRNQYERVTFHEITPNALREAFLHPRDIDMNAVHAQETRRFLDRIVGYELSPLLWRRFSTSNLSAGRVQSAALKMIVDRAKEIAEHTPEPYWKLQGLFKEPVSGMELLGWMMNEQEIAIWDDVADVKDALRYLGRLKDWKATFQSKSSRKNPNAPFTTSSLQQEAYQRYNIPTKRTMQLAQALYEAGHITYMRTDSTLLSEEARKKIGTWIREELGDTYHQERVHATKNEHAQEAHEAIRPTHIHVRADQLDSEKFSAQHRKLYELIWRRTVASQMPPAVYQDLIYTIQTPTNPEWFFQGKTSVLIELGYLSIYSPDTPKPTMSAQEWEPLLKTPRAVEMQELKGIGEITKPPSLYHEPSLIKAMEKEGIGRPATYASILEKIQEKGYVSMGMNPQSDVKIAQFVYDFSGKKIQESMELVHIGGKDMDRFVPTSLGERVILYLEGIVPFLLNLQFTAEMENKLDAVRVGNVTKPETLGRFYEVFHPAVVQAEEISRQKRKGEKAPEIETPKNKKEPLKRFDANMSIMQTRYGPALFYEPDKKFVSVIPYLEWRGKSVTEMTMEEARNLMSLPRAIPGSTRTLCIGRYGFYLQDGNTNLPLKKELWELAWNNELSGDHINDVTKPAPYKKFIRKRAPDS